MTIQRFFGDFESVEDVLKKFKVKNFSGEIVYAIYDQDRYNGKATVVFKERDNYYVVEASHCSCYGLEGLWEPDLSSFEELTRMWGKDKTFMNCLLNS